MNKDQKPLPSDRMTTPDLEPWQESEHAIKFDGLVHWPDIALKRYYESFNDIQLLHKAKDALTGTRLLEVGCATGDLSRYVRRNLPAFDYAGGDISVAAIERAREKFPDSAFYVVEADLSNIAEHFPDPNVLYCKDVVLHQYDPFGFLDRLLAIPSDMAVIRLRTRDQGETVLDPDISCQKHYSGWVPYMILNIDELVDVIRHCRPTRTIEIVRNHIVLGGQNGRYLPRDCYLPETGTSETAVLIRFASQKDNSDGKIEITIRDQPEVPPPYSLWDRLRRQISMRL